MPQVAVAMRQPSLPRTPSVPPVAVAPAPPPGQQGSLRAGLPPPLVMPAPCLVMPPMVRPPTAGSHASAPLAPPTPDAVDQKLREWLDTIPMGNSEERGWDDSQIKAIAQFARDHYLDYLTAEEIYKRYVEHQVRLAGCESPGLNDSADSHS